jgi:hypothetical protein
MKIGDKVRLVHGKEEGTIYAFLPGNVVEIEIEDGFRIPVLKNEIVTISPVETQRMVREPAATAAQKDVIVPRNKPFSEKGIYLAFIAVNDRTVTAHIVNQSDWTLPFTAYTKTDKSATGLAAGVLAPKTSQKLTELELRDFEKWPTFEFRLLHFRSENTFLPVPMSKSVKCRAQSFYKNKKKVPILDREGYVYQLDEENLKADSSADHERI